MEVSPISIAEEKYYNSKVFPLTLSPKSPSSLTLFEEWLTNNKPTVEKYLEDHGAVLFRGFPIGSPEDFARFVLALKFENFPYVGGNAVRRSVVDDIVITANEAPAKERIPWHHEMAQVPVFPRKLFFYCQTPAETGGETPILLSNELYEKLLVKQPKCVELVEKEGVIYTRVMTSYDRPESSIGRGWKSTFKVETKEEAEAKLKEKGYRWEWLEEDRLREITPVLPAVKVDPRSGKKQYFNQMMASYFGWRDVYNTPGKTLYAGNGVYFEEQFMTDTLAIAEEICVAYKWQVGDILLVDNNTVMHSRKPFTGDRKILVSLGK